MTKAYQHIHLRLSKTASSITLLTLMTNPVEALEVYLDRVFIENDELGGQQTLKSKLAMNLLAVLAHPLVPTEFKAVFETEDINRE